MSGKEILEAEKDKFNDYFNSLKNDFSNYLSTLIKETYKESNILNEISAKKSLLVQYVTNNFPVQDAYIINGITYLHPSTVVNYNLNCMTSQMYSEFEELHEKFLKGL